MWQLTGLTGVKKKNVPATMVRCRTGFVKTIKSGKFATSAGDDGSLTAWKDDAGILRGTFDSYGVSQSAVEFDSYAKLQRWIDEWYPKMGR